MDPIWPLPGNSPWPRRREKPRSRPRPRPRDRPSSPARPRAQPEPPPLGRPGVPAAGREVSAAGTAGTCSLRVGGPGRAAPREPGAGACRPAACPWEAGAEPGCECWAPRARKPVLWRRMVGSRVSPRGPPYHAASTTSEPANALGTRARASAGCLRPFGSRRGRLSLLGQCPGPHLMLWSESGRDPRVRPGGLSGQGTSLQLLAQRMSRMRSSGLGFV